jgi:hypothetical protein
MTTYPSQLEEIEAETRVRALAILVAAVASVIIAAAIVMLLVLQPWSDGWELEPRPEPGALTGSEERQSRPRTLNGKEVS